MNTINPPPISELQAQVDAILPQLRSAKTDLEAIEVKSAEGGFPQSVRKSISAFSNGRGGLIIFGLSDADFKPVQINAAKIAADLASTCSDDFEPKVRPTIGICVVEGSPVVAARIPPQGHLYKPCYLRAEGMYLGSYLRVHDGNRLLTHYEIQLMVSGRGQPVDDAEPVERASIKDLDEELVGDLLKRIRDRRSRRFTKAADHEVLHMLDVLAEPKADSPVTLGGLVALGRYPQQFLPQLSASFVALPTTDGSSLSDGTRFLDNQPLDGPIPEIVSLAMTAMFRNMRRRAVIDGFGRRDVWDYPPEAIREIVTNALMHRDYHPIARGAQVRISLYPDRFEVASPGGLHGIHAGHDDVNHLINSSTSSTRNALLARLLEDVVLPRTGKPVCENRGSGLRAAVLALEREGRGPPQIDDQIRSLVVTIHRDIARDNPVPYVSTSAYTSHRLDVTARANVDPFGSRANVDPFGSRANVDPFGARANYDPNVVAQPISQQAQQRAEPFNERIIRLLEAGPQSSAGLAAALATSKQTILVWLRRLRAEGMVAPTLAEPQTRGNKWVLSSQQ